MAGALAVGRREPTEDAMLTMIKKLETKRILAMAIGPGLAGLGLDAAISHFAGRSGMVVPPQYVPVLFAPLACVLTMAFAMPKVKAKVFSVAMRSIGAAGIVVGLLGTGFHVRALMRLLEGLPLTWANLEPALAVAPPLFAPGAFAAIGAIVWALGSRKVVIRFAPEEGTVMRLPGSGAVASAA